LKYLAIQCNAGVFQGDRIPIFITLKKFAEAEEQPSLLEYITQFFSDCDVAAEQAALLLKHGRALILLDGLDEVKEEDDRRISKQVRDFSEKFRTNQFVITCRIAARKYIFDKFTEVEVADFDGRQIATFVEKWFQDKEPAKAEGLIQQLRENRPILELATNPLLLTLLCLVFEESAKFPTNRSELYEEGIDILLKRWDETREIERTQIYKNLSVQRKKDLLSKIALITFESGDYFFKQKELERYISDYIRHLAATQNDKEALQLDSEAVLKSIEAQHGLLVERAKGIYSFSHVTLQEYFTAKQIVECSKHSTLERLASHLMDSRCREVLLFVTEMLPSAEALLSLIKHQVDAVIAQDTKLQAFLTWISQKSNVFLTPYKHPAVRAFYLESALVLDELLIPSFYELDDVFDLTRTLDFRLDNGLDLSRPLFYTLELDSALTRTLYWASQWFSLLSPYEAREMPYEHTNGVDSGLASALDCISYHNYEFQQLLENLKEQLPPLNDGSEDDFERIPAWWNANGRDWIENLRAVMIEHCDIGHDWQFTEQQKQLLKRYYEANKLLGDCLNSAFKAKTVTLKVRSQIEETLLLPIAEVENRSHRG
jgi:predicted NACHT family NTPase